MNPYPYYQNLLQPKFKSEYKQYLLLKFQNWWWHGSIVDVNVRESPRLLYDMKFLNYTGTLTSKELWLNFRRF